MLLVSQKSFFIQARYVLLNDHALRLLFQKQEICDVSDEQIEEQKKHIFENYLFFPLSMIPSNAHICYPDTVHTVHTGCLDGQINTKNTRGVGYLQVFDMETAILARTVLFGDVSPAPPSSSSSPHTNRGVVQFVGLDVEWKASMFHIPDNGAAIIQVI